MSEEFPKYYKHKKGFGYNLAYVMRINAVEGKNINFDRSERTFAWNASHDRCIAIGDWFEVPREVIESENVYAFDPASGPDENVTALWSGTKMIATIDGNGVFRFKVDATDANAAEFITMIEEFLKRRVTAVDVTESEPALPV